jgi:sec-independent protein translocase protein TatA
MPIRFGAPELMILLVIVLLLFGVGRISKIAGEVGKGIRLYKIGVRGEREKRKYN